MFDWDDGNVDHIARHNVAPEEAEDALLDRHRLTVPARSAAHERRWAVLGETEGARILYVIFTRRQNLIRVVTARSATATERRQYRRK
jgi:uncharacterized DUF497 family protein